MLYYLTIFIVAVILTIFSTVIVRRLALKFDIVDRPGPERKIHKISVPLLGGVAVFFPLFLMFYFVSDKLLEGSLESRHWLGLFTGACFLMIGGFLDDKYGISPKYQVIWPVLASLSVIAGGVSIAKITNPLGSFFYFGPILSGTFIFLWLVGMMYTTKLLDGIDGLVTGVTAIGALIIFLFTMTTRYYQPDLGVAALILAGCSLGFLVFNWHPAKIFLGEGGSLLLGYVLGVLAIISGGKIAIALLIMGLPIMDVVWTIARRIGAGKNPFRFADRKHLHFRLLDLGLGQRKTALVYYFFAAVFGLSALFLQSTGKLVALGFLVIIMLGAVIIFSRRDRKSV
jgi:UDP-GlcNAc:undecaprenyl-phosphate GlcNAc-1-phosphate transferase